MLSLTPTSWFLLAVWILLLIIGYGWKKLMFMGSSAVLGLILGIDLLSQNGLIGLTFIFLNSYLLYSVLWEEKR